MTRRVSIRASSVSATATLDDSRTARAIWDALPIEAPVVGDLLDVGSTAGESDESVVIITDAGEGSRLGVVVDELCGHQQVVIKSIEESYGSVPGIAAATILGNGRVAFILDLEKLSDIASSPALGAVISVKRSSAAAAVAH